jgi:hypothetical protein
LNFPRMISSITVVVLVVCWAPASTGQVAKDGSDARFYDDLLDRLVGKWEVSAVVHGQKFTLDREADWVLSHQYLRIHEKSREVVPWLKVPFERTLYVGYNHRSKRYVVHELTVHGADTPFEPEGFYYGARSGNELAMDHMNGANVFARSRWTWDPRTSSWHFQGRRVIDGKEQAPHVDQVAVAARPVANSTEIPADIVAMLKEHRGEWSSDGWIIDGEKRTPIKASWECKAAVYGFGNVCTWNHEWVDRPHDSALEIMGYDPRLKVLSITRVLDTGVINEPAAVTVRGNTMNVERRSTENGKLRVVRNEIVVTRPGEWSQQVTIDVDGKRAREITLTQRRVKSTPDLD